jgi:hypothetical protein
MDDTLNVELANLETSSSDASLVNYDPSCDPIQPKRIKFSDISSAAFNIRDGIIITPSTVKF